MFFKGKHLRVTTPKTTNGQIPLIVNGIPQTVVTFAPLTAKKALEKKNARLARTGFKHLVATIEEVSDEPTQVAEKPKAAAAKKAENKPAAPQNISEALQADDTNIKL